MTELEKLQRAKMYVDKLANGINPIDDIPASDADIINNVRTSRCLFYVSEVLRQVIENGVDTRKTKVPQKAPFYLTDEQKTNYVPSNEPVTITWITHSLNEAADLEKCRKMHHSIIADWLISIGALELRKESNGHSHKYATPKGTELGITNEIRVGMSGEYNVVVYNKEAQQFIIDNIEAMVSFYSEAKHDDQ